MRVLYAFPATGFGHISRAAELVPILQNKVELDVLISGPNRYVPVPFDVSYRFEGLTFFAGVKGGIDFKKTFFQNSLIRTLREIKSLNLSEYDLIISDFEPISAYGAKRIKHPNCVELSHQSAVLHPKAPKPPRTDLLGKFFLNHVCPIEKKFGFHFWSYDSSIYTPVIRKEIRQIETSDLGHYCVYLPAYSPECLYSILRKLPSKYHIFSQQINHSYKKENCQFYPSNNSLFTESLASSRGVLCGAGFETPAEALFLGKKLMVVPMKGQFEQQCNAFALKKLGVETMQHLSHQKLEQLSRWIEETEAIQINYSDISEKIIDKLLTSSDSLAQKDFQEKLQHVVY